MKIKKTKQLNLGLIACLMALPTLAACYDERKVEKPISDCSAIFETRSANNVKIAKNGEELATERATECKILEIKVDKNTKCEIVGSDKIENLKDVLSENENNKIILVAPEKQFSDAAKSANKYLLANGIDLKKHLGSEIFNEISFPYKGMRCVVEDKKFAVWLGDKKVIVTIENK